MHLYYSCLQTAESTWASRPSSTRRQRAETGRRLLAQRHPADSNNSAVEQIDSKTEKLID